MDWKHPDIPNEKPLENLPADGGFTAIFRRIAVVGDSLSSGEFEGLCPDGNHSYHDMFEYSWGQFLGRMCHSEVFNFSRGGMTAKEYCDWFADAMGYWNAKYASQAYIIALGVNDIFGQNQPVGTVDDVDFSDWHNNNTQTIAGYYAQIIQRLKAIQPRAKFFLMTIPNGQEDHPSLPKFRKLLYDFAEKFDNTYVLDFYEYAPIYDEDFKKNYYMLGHLNPMGYCLTAKFVAAYIDYIIRHNMHDFFEVGFIGTDLHSTAE